MPTIGRDMHFSIHQNARDKAGQGIHICEPFVITDVTTRLLPYDIARLVRCAMFADTYALPDFTIN